MSQQTPPTIWSIVAEWREEADEYKRLAETHDKPGEDWVKYRYLDLAVDIYGRADELEAALRAWNAGTDDLAERLGIGDLLTPESVKRCLLGLPRGEGK